MPGYEANFVLALETSYCAVPISYRAVNIRVLMQNVFFCLLCLYKFLITRENDMEEIMIFPY